MLCSSQGAAGGQSCYLGRPGEGRGGERRRRGGHGYSHLFTLTTGQQTPRIFRVFMNVNMYMLSRQELWKRV